MVYRSKQNHQLTLKKIKKKRTKNITMDVVGLKFGGMMLEVLVGLHRTSTSSLLFTGIASLVGALVVYLYKPYWELRKIPGPPVSFLVGHLPLMMKHGPDVFNVLAKHYGPIYRSASFPHLISLSLPCFL